MKKFICLSILIFFNLLSAQENNYSLIFSVGRASDNDAMGNFGGGGASFQFWEAGPIFRLGIEIYFNEPFSVQSTINYSFYKYDGSKSYGSKTNIGYNNFLDLMNRLKWKLGFFNVNLGIGISHQFSDDIRYLEETEYHAASIFIHSKNKTIVAGLIGIGLDIKLNEKFSLVAEGDWFLREYLGSAWLVGVKYSLPEL